MTPAMVSGLGKYHGKNKGSYKSIDYTQIQALVDNPQQSDKDGAQWVIPSILSSRVHAKQREFGEFWMLWADLDKNPPRVEVVENLVKVLGCDYEIYASRSATERLPKCRILIPLSRGILGADWLICQRLLNDLFFFEDLIPDRSTQRTGQPCYLPNRGRYYFSRSRRQGIAFDAMSVWEGDIEVIRGIVAAEMAQKQAEREAKAQTSKEVDPSQSLIHAFNAAYTIEELLFEAGYDEKDGKFRHPASESGSFSANIKDGRVYTFSSNDPLYTEGEGAHDAFSVFTVLFADGELNKALKLAGDERVLIDGKPWNEVKRLERAVKEFEVSAYDALAAQIEQASSREDLMVKIPAAITAAKDLNEVMRKELRKLLSSKSGISVMALEADAKAFNRVHANKDNDHLPAAREVVKTFGEDNLICVHQVFWQWQDDRIWCEIDDRVVKQRIHKVSASRTLTANVVNSILDLVKTELNRPNHRFNEVDPDSISLVNGVLVYKAGGWILRPHRREDYKNTLVSVAYDPAAKAPRFEQFLEEIYSGAADKEQRILATKQALGYTLIPSCRFEKFFMLIGAGANGKSVLLRVVEGLVGRQQVCAVQPTHFENPHKLAHLSGKLANIITEMPEGGKIADAALKALISGELMTADKKFQEPFDFYPVATHWYGTNHLPYTRDYSEAFFRRALLIQFPNKFYGEQRDPNLATKLLRELPGILNLALEGLASLIEAGEFVIPESSRKAAEAWRLDADQVAQFAREKLTASSGKFLTVDQIYQRYRSWAEDCGIKLQLGKNKLSERLRDLGFVRAKGSKGSRGFRDVDWRNDYVPGSLGQPEVALEPTLVDIDG
jgi:P4 family phage/plasmid primase-like protien